MSLINDALKRAKEVHTNNPPPVPDNLHLRPAEPDSQPRKGIGIVLPATAATFMLAALFSFWQLRGGNHTKALGQTEITVHATGNQIPDAPAPEVQTPTAVNAASAPVSAADSPANPAQTTAQTNAIALAQESSAKTQDASPKPAPLQLKAIVFNPTRPSAIIDGKTVFVGDKVREFRVAAITPVSATLASSTQTNVLTLE